MSLAEQFLNEGSNDHFQLDDSDSEEERKGVTEEEEPLKEEEDFYQLSDNSLLSKDEEEETQFKATVAKVGKLLESTGQNSQMKSGFQSLLSDSDLTFGESKQSESSFLPAAKSES